jgi:hypothetical protein
MHDEQAAILIPKAATRELDPADRPLKVIRPASFSTLTVVAGISALIHHYDLLYTLTLFRINIRYKQSALGWVWAALQPLALMMIYTLIFSRFAKVSSEGVPYPLFVFSALLPWIFFSSATDGWSMGLLFDEIGEHYAAFSTGRDPELPALPIQYSDFANWQKQAVSGDHLTEHLAYWRKTLRGAQTVLELQTDRPRLSVHTGRGDDVYLQVGEAVTEELRGLAQSEGATLFMALLTVFQVLLRRYTSQESILVGTPTAGRNDVEMERLIGFS